jgi:hypothetical protein
VFQQLSWTWQRVQAPSLRLNWKVNEWVEYSWLLHSDGEGGLTGTGVSGVWQT